jgi:hypothetical protein
MTAKLDLTQFEGHTPGPWGLKRVTSQGGLVYTLIGNPLTLSLCSSVGVAFAGTYAKKGVRTVGRITDAETSATASLIAAAPDLLALARSQAEQIERLRYGLERTLAALSTNGLENVQGAKDGRAALAETEGK